ncbi:MAG: hypothetical protein Q8R92_15915 [Deltaproteobacteria bacterium]|nr:hypothetical protein [Deltaproteobacteria bacterium]
MTRPAPLRLLPRTPPSPPRLDDMLAACKRGPSFIGLVGAAPPYDPGPRKKLPGWAKHLHHLRPLKLVE